MTRHPSGDSFRIWDLPPDLRAPAVARDLTRKTLADWGLDAVADDILLVVSELVTNAAVHGAPPIRLQLRLEPECLYGSVVDHGGILPRRVNTQDDMTEHGRGLALISTITTSAGWKHTPAGATHVWFTYRLPRR